MKIFKNYFENKKAKFPFTFSDIECDWNGELLIINEDIRHIQKGNVIFLFEIVDILSNARNIEQYGRKKLENSLFL